MKKSIFILFFIFFSSLIAQNKQINIQWEDRINVSTDEMQQVIVPGFERNLLEYNLESKKITYQRVFELSGSYSIVNVQTASVDKGLLKEIEAFDEDFTPEVNYSKARGIDKVIVRFNPFLKKGTAFHKVTSFTLVQSSKEVYPPKTLSKNSVQGIKNSVLAFGKFYQFIVEKTGIQKIDAAFLVNLGINLSTVDPSRIKIYSHGGRMLPLRNSENLPHMFDPPQIPLKVVTQNPNSFQQGDEIYFYGEATEGYYSSENETNLNVYANDSYYFITVDGELGERVKNYQEPIEVEDELITTFDDYAYYEIDETSTSLVGRRWFGDRFDITTQRNYSFSFQNLIKTEPITIKVLLAGVSSSNSSMRVSANGNSLTTINILPTGNTLPSRGASFNGQFFSNEDNININLSYNKQGNPAARSFLDYISLQAKRELTASNQQFKFQNKQASQSSGIGRYVIENASLVQEVWEITNTQEIFVISNQQSSNQFSFKSSLGLERTFIANVQEDAYVPLINQINRDLPNSNLKGTIFNNSQNQFEDIDYLVITNNQLLVQAQQLANYRKESGLTTRAVSVEQIYREFNSNKQDIGAIRNFIRYVYENASTPENKLKYVVFLGDASVDYKERLPGNNNIVPTFQNVPSFATTESSFMSDDFFAMMDPNEGAMSSSDMLDLAIGRILADTPQLAQQMISKIIDYDSRPSYASWRNNLLLISDDVDKVWEFDRIQKQLDELGDEIAHNKPFINVRKIHMDAFEQISSAGGDRYPTVNKAITEQIELGVSVVNYFGHGGEDGLAQERVVTQTDVQSWRNPFRYNLFVTITCEFTKFDNPLRITAGELAFWNPQGGPVSMITTTRAITVEAGVSFNNELAPFLFDYENKNETIAESVMRTKNALGGNGKRIIFYLGDPALRLPYGDQKIRLRTLNGVPFDQSTDTLKALSRNIITGEIVNQNEQRITNYNGNLTATIFDKPIQRQTLGNDGTEIGGQLAIMDFNTLGETLFRGQSSVTNGEFSVEFILPLDTRIPVDKGRISMYAIRNDILGDQVGSDETMLVGAINQNAPTDNEGPLIQLFMNDETFIDGGITDSSPFLFAKLEDESGINTAGGIGHDILAILDEDDANPFILNDYYKAVQDDFTRGEVYFPLRDIEPGLHTLRLRAWDTHNNSSEIEIQFVVSEDNELLITRVLNYPNPFVNYTEFWFNHNRPFEPLEVQVQVFTVSGKLVWTQNQLVNTDGFLSRDITWDGRDDFGDRIGKGIYVYKLTVRSTLTNQRTEKYEKLVIL